MSRRYPRYTVGGRNPRVNSECERIHQVIVHVCALFCTPALLKMELLGALLFQEETMNIGLSIVDDLLFYATEINKCLVTTFGKRSLNIWTSTFCWDNGFEVGKQILVIASCCIAMSLSHSPVIFSFMAGSTLSRIILQYTYIDCRRKVS